MTPLGEALRTARLAKGISLADISAETRVGARYLEALETGQYQILPGSLFARNFARQYASFVGLDPESLEPEIESAFPRATEMPPPETSSAPQIQVAPLAGGRAWKEANWRRIGWSLFALAAMLGAGSGIYRVSEALPDLVSAARSEAREARRMRTQVPVPTQASAASANKAGVSSGEQLLTDNIPSEAYQLGAASTDTAAGAGIENSITISANGMAVRLVASEETWVSVTANGKQVFRGILEPNQTTTVSGVENARLVVGNAGGLKVVTDGKDIGPIGPPGTVRVVVLSPDGSRILRQSDEAPNGNRSRDTAI